jgi:hypothetical protein
VGLKGFKRSGSDLKFRPIGIQIRPCIFVTSTWYIFSLVTYWAYDLDVSGSPTHNISIHILSYILNIFHSKNPKFAPLKEKESRSACIGSAIDDYLTSLSISFIYKIRIGVSLCESSSILFLYCVSILLSFFFDSSNFILLCRLGQQNFEISWS